MKKLTLVSLILSMILISCKERGECVSCRNLIMTKPL